MFERFFVWAACCALASCASSKAVSKAPERRSPEQHRAFLTTLDYHKTGDEAAHAYLKKRFSGRWPEIEEALRRAQRSCIRIENSFSEGFFNVTIYSREGSGVALSVGKGRFLLTNGSLLRWSDARRIGENEIDVTLRDGTELEILVRDSALFPISGRFGDWALIEVDGAAARSIKPVPVRPPVPGELALILGYPNGLGKNENGDVVFRKAYDAAPLSPLLAVATVRRASPLMLEPVAGFEPFGLDGAGVFGLRGECIGMFHHSGPRSVSGEIAASSWLWLALSAEEIEKSNAFQKGF